MRAYSLNQTSRTSHCVLILKQTNSFTFSGGAGGSAGLLHVAGVYAGYGKRDDTRASLPNPLALSVSGDGVAFVAAGLSLRDGAWLERLALPCAGTNATVEVKRYAHRQYKNVLVLQLQVFGATVKGYTCKVQFNRCVGKPGGVITRPGPLYEVISPEEPATPDFPKIPATVVAIANDPIPPSIGFNDSVTSHTFLCVVRSTLEKGITNSTATSVANMDLATYKAMQPQDLWYSHVVAWSRVWGTTGGAGSGGGIEIGGNATLAAQVNSSLYYMLSSVRADWPWGISEGGIASNSYYGTHTGTFSHTDTHTCTHATTRALFPTP